MDSLHMVINLRKLIIVIFCIFSVGCESTSVVDLCIFNKISNIKDAEDIIRNNFAKFEDEETFPYKPKANCGVKKNKYNKVFFCIESDSIVVGATLNHGDEEDNRIEFKAIIGNLKNKLEAGNVKFSENYNKNADLESVKKLNMYQ